MVPEAPSWPLLRLQMIPCWLAEGSVVKKGIWSVMHSLTWDVGNGMVPAVESFGRSRVQTEPSVWTRAWHPGSM